MVDPEPLSDPLTTTVPRDSELPSSPYWRQVARGDTGAARRHARSLQARAAIIDAAGGQFAQRGYAAASLSEVAVGCGLTKGSLYFHFRSKEDLARAVVDVMLERWQAMRAEVAALGHDPLDSLIIEVDRVIARSEEDPVIRGGVRLSYDPDLTTDNARTHFRYGEQAVVEQLMLAERQELLRDGVDIHLVARQVIALMCGHRVLHAVSGEPGSMRAGMHEAWPLLLTAVARPGWIETSAGLHHN